MPLLGRTRQKQRLSWHPISVQTAYTVFANVHHAQTKTPVSTHPHDHIPDHIKRTTRTLGYALWLDEPDAWLDVMAAMGLRLSPEERAHLALAAFHSRRAETVELIAAGLLEPAGRPAFLGGMFDARLCDQVASLNKLKAYGRAAVEAMRQEDQAALVRHLGQEVAA
ncbi:MAG: hypothetical protein AAGA70_01710 [Pseudomonadota bacterium]